MAARSLRELSYLVTPSVVGHQRQRIEDVPRKWVTGQSKPPGMEAMGREMKEVVDRHITQRLHREQRPGGMLYQARRG